MNVFSRLRNSSWPSPSYCYQMNGIDIRFGYMNLRGILGGKRTIHYKSISDILISMFSGINKCSQGRNIFMIDFGSSQYQKFVISLICVSAEFPAYSGSPAAGRSVSHESSSPGHSSPQSGDPLDDLVVTDQTALVALSLPLFITPWHLISFFANTCPLSINSATLFIYYEHEILLYYVSIIHDKNYNTKKKADIIHSK